MTFLSPLFLIGLIPWSAISIWLLWGRRQRTDVPFLEFWREAAEETHARRRMKVPPVAIALAIAAMLLAVLAAARPLVHGIGSARGPRVTVIVDRGITMSATQNRTIRFRAAAEAAQQMLRATGRDLGSLDLLAVPGEPTPRFVSGDWAAAVASLPPTALETSAALQSTIAARRAADDDGMILVISDHDLHRHDSRLIQISPETIPVDVGIVMLAASATPRPQVMARIRNQSSQTSTTLTVESGGQPQRRQIDLPPRGGERDYFIDMPQLGDTVEAMLDLRDDIPADDKAWLVRERSWPRIAAGEGVSPELRRMIAVYESRHAPSAASQTLAIVSQLDAAPPSGPVVVVVAPAASAPVAAAIETVDHPITRHINWEALAPSLSWNTDPPRGWQPLISVGGHTLVAARDDPARQVWVGIGGSQWPASTDFVMFWANVFDWAGQGGERFADRDLADLTPEWRLVDPGAAGQAGIYENGVQRGAFNAWAPDLTPPPQTNWRSALAAWSREAGGGMALGPFAILLALICLTASAMTWRQSRRLSFSSMSNHEGDQQSEALLSR